MFPKKYVVLNQQNYSLGEYSIVPIRYKDRIEIMNWRNEQMYHLRQQERLTEENQNKYFNEVVTKIFEQTDPNQLLFSYLKSNECIGYGGLVHINWLEKTAEISFIMNTELEELEFGFHWSKYLALIEQLAFDELKLNTIFTYAFDLRPYLYPVLEKNKYQLKKRIPNFIEIDDDLKDVVIHEKHNRNISLRTAEQKDLELLFEWANDELVRKQSFQSKPIIFEEHKIWFNKKLDDKYNLFHILEIDKTPFSLVRYTINKNETTIGVLLDKNYRGQNLSTAALIKSCNNYFQNFDQPILAYIKKSNIASKKSFERAGFTFYKDDEVNGKECFVYQLIKNGK